MLDYLQRDPWGFLQLMLYRAPAVLLALTLHEVAHGFAALKAGDPTAQRMGRLSLNPLKHLDPIGTLSLFLLGFGWARPVPVNPRNFRSRRRDEIIVSLAGVTVNFLLFLMFTVLALLIGGRLYAPSALAYFGGPRFFLGLDQPGFVMQLFPEYAQDLAPILVKPGLLHLQRFLLHSCLVNLGLCLFNLLPIPPLDGFHVLNQGVLGGRFGVDSQMFRFFQLGMIILVFATDIVGKLMSVMMGAVQGAVLRLLLSLMGG